MQAVASCPPLLCAGSPQGQGLSTHILLRPLSVSPASLLSAPSSCLFPTPHLTKSHLPSLPLHLPRKCCPSVVSGSLSGQPRPQPERIVTGNPSVNNIESTEGAECLLPEPWAWGSLRCGPESLFHSSLPSFPSSLFLPQGKQLHQIFAP